MQQVRVVLGRWVCRVCRAAHRGATGADKHLHCRACGSRCWVKR